MWYRVECKCTALRCNLLSKFIIQLFSVTTSLFTVDLLPMKPNCSTEEVYYLINVCKKNLAKLSKDLHAIEFRLTGL